MLIRLVLINLLILTFTCFTEAQVTVRSIQLGYKIFDMAHMVTGPYSMLEHVKDRRAHEERLKWYEDHEGQGNRGLSGGGGYYMIGTIHLNAELGKDNDSRFWKRHTIQLGGFISNRIMHDGVWMHKSQQIELQGQYQRFEYRFRNYQRFAGVNLGLNRRFPIVKNHFNFILGFYTQVGTTLTNRYEQEIVTFSPPQETPFTKSIERLEDFYGHTYTQWHLTIPLGFEGTIDRFSLRAQFHLGYLDDRYRDSTVDQEAHGLTFWLGYRLKK